MERIDITKIRGKWVEIREDGNPIGGGDNTVESIRLVAEKVNEIIDYLDNEKNKKEA